MDFPKETARCRDGRWDMILCCLSDLTFVACLDIPFDIIDEHGPPKSKHESGADCEYSLVTKVVMRFLDKSVSLRLSDI
jgi:hypothetical protein